MVGKILKIRNKYRISLKTFKYKTAVLWILTFFIVFEVQVWNNQDH